MKFQIKFNFFVRIIFIFIFLFTSNLIKAEMPELKGLYDLFVPDVIGIGRALFAKGWIENVYTYAPDDNKAKIVIKQFWRKNPDNELDNFVLSNLAPGSCITPEILGKLLNLLAIKKNEFGGRDFEKEKSELLGRIYKDASVKYRNDDFKKVRKIIDLIAKMLEKEERSEGIASGVFLESEIFWGIFGYEHGKVFVDSIDFNNLVVQKTYKDFENEMFKNAEFKKVFKEYIKGKQENSESVNNAIKRMQEFIECIKNINKNGKGKYGVSEYEKIKKELIDIWFKNCAGKSVSKDKVKQVIEYIEALKNSGDFIPETAEGILWALFFDKFKTKKGLDLCLKELGKNIDNNIWDKDKYKEFKVAVNKTRAETIIKKIASKNYYDFATYSTIKFANIKIVPNKVEQGKFAFKGINKPFSTCFESALLDVFSIFFYDPKEKTYDLKILPEKVISSADFKRLEKQVFLQDEKELISPDGINGRMQQWIDIIENLPEIAYGSSVGDIHYDLDTNFENLIKILNKFYGLSLKIKSDPVNLNSLEINIDDIKEVANTENAQEFWNQLFSLVKSKLSTQGRIISFDVKVVKLAGEDKKVLKVVNGSVKTEKTIGVVSIKIEYKDPEYSEFDVSFEIHIESGHAFLTCKKRDELGLSFYSKRFENLLSDEFYASGNTKFYPIFILLANLNTKEPIEKKDINKIKNLLYYCCNFKDANVKVKFIKEKFIENSGNKAFDRLISSLIDKMVPDSHLLCELISFFSKYKGVDEIIDKLIVKNLPAVGYSILVEDYFVGKELKEKIIKMNLSSDENMDKFAEKFKNKAYDIKKLFNLKLDFITLDKIAKKIFEKSSGEALIFNFLKNVEFIIKGDGEIFNKYFKENIKKYLFDEKNKKDNYKKMVDFIHSNKLGSSEKYNLLEIIPNLDETIRAKLFSIIYDSLLFDIEYYSADPSFSNKHFYLVSEIIEFTIKKSRDNVIMGIILDTMLKHQKIIDLLIVKFLSKENNKDNITGEIVKYLIENSSCDLIFKFLHKWYPCDPELDEYLSKYLVEKINKCLSDKDKSKENYKILIDQINGQSYEIKKIISMIKDEKLKEQIIFDTKYKKF